MAWEGRSRPTTWRKACGPRPLARLFQGVPGPRWPSPPAGAPTGLAAVRSARPVFRIMPAARLPITSRAGQVVKMPPTARGAAQPHRPGAPSSGPEALSFHHRVGGFQQFARASGDGKKCGHGEAAGSGWPLLLIEGVPATCRDTTVGNKARRVANLLSVQIASFGPTGKDQTCGDRARTG